MVSDSDNMTRREHEGPDVTQPNSEGHILQINVSRGGVPKHPVEQAIVTSEGIVGDYQRDQRNHGGPMRALCLFTIEEIQRLQAEGHPITPGSSGENITLEGIDLAALTPEPVSRLATKSRSS